MIIFMVRYGKVIMIIFILWLGEVRWGKVRYGGVRCGLVGYGMANLSLKVRENKNEKKARNKGNK